jgi:hypothetical protein
MVENMEEGIECLWRVHPLLDIIHYQQIDALIEVDEIVRGILTYRIGELHLEQSCTYIEYTFLWISLAALKSDGIDEVGFTTTRRTIDKEGVECCFPRMLSDRETNSTWELIRGALDIVVEALLGVELWVELLLAWSIEHAGRLVDVLANRNGLNAGALTFNISCYIAALALWSLYLYDSVVKLNACSKHSRKYLT